MKRLLLIFLFLFGLCFSVDYTAQTGGRQREKAGKSRGRGINLKRTKSAGHADKFARQSGRKGIFKRLFRKNPPSWVNRPTGNPKKNWKENRFLFSRHRSQGKIDNHTYQSRQNARRARHRTRGNEGFSGKKYKRR